MAEIVGAFGVSHAPSALVQYQKFGSASEVVQRFERVRRDLDAVDPDVIVIFDSDHVNQFFLNNMPTFAVGVAEETSGPHNDDGWLGSVQYDHIPVHYDLGDRLYRGGINEGFDLALTNEFIIDHSISIPIFFLNPELSRPIVPIWINGFIAPLPLAGRCYRLGEAMRKVIEAWPAHLRVAVVASGAISNDIGSPRVVRGGGGAGGNPEFVELVERRIVNGEIDELINEVTPARIAADGNVTGEILNWFALLGLVGDRRPVYYESEYRHNDEGEALPSGMAYGVWRWDA